MAMRTLDLGRNAMATADALLVLQTARHTALAHLDFQDNPIGEFASNGVAQVRPRGGALNHKIA